VLLCGRGWVALLFVVSDGRDTQNRALLVYYALSSGIFLPTFRDNLSFGQISCLVPLSLSVELHSMDFLVLKDGTNSLFRNVGKKLPLLPV